MNKVITNIPNKAALLMVMSHLGYDKVIKIKEFQKNKDKRDFPCYLNKNKNATYFIGTNENWIPGIGTEKIAFADFIRKEFSSEKIFQLLLCVCDDYSAFIKDVDNLITNLKNIK